MTLEQLRAQLAELNLPGDTLIVLSADSEGNTFSPLSETSSELYDAENSHSGTVSPTHEWLDKELAFPAGPWSEEDRAPATAVPAVVLWPAN